MKPPEVSESQCCSSHRNPLPEAMIHGFLYRTESSGDVGRVTSCRPFSSYLAVSLVVAGIPRLADVVQVTGVVGDQTTHSSSFLMLAKMMCATF
ncbi:hypothetical protein ASPBRDRAFT_370179 [Aspergillus brasiliensis CBS 101740]|uniref:Uncharacterized protein n=1 Tax=Aspergillus brasiliensis (strain CBS 101740 / IMI 381727 / IBT 21946) TaxID=767769 RepID=A0A1L9UV54_ASPBC|nr:hypothetical protein ASPBRDRAFT_370179 [Aspergillus brasiliensis CBS 101740]